MRAINLDGSRSRLGDERSGASLRAKRVICALAEARRKGCHRLSLDSGHQRAEAHLLCEDLGFVHAGRHYVLTL